MGVRGLLGGWADADRFIHTSTEIHRELGRMPPGDGRGGGVSGGDGRTKSAGKLLHAHTKTACGCGTASRILASASASAASCADCDVM